MRKNHTLLANLVISVFFIFGCTLCTPLHRNHFGEWKVNENGKNWSLILSKDGSALLVLNNQVFGGNDFELDGKSLSLRYEIDYSKTPIWLDFYVKEESTGSERKLSSIVRFLTDTKMEIRFNFDYPNSRLDSFDPNDHLNTGVFEKVLN
jgi:hypothetical protein